MEQFTAALWFLGGATALSLLVLLVGGYHLGTFLGWWRRAP